MYQSLHQNDEVFDSEELNFKMKFRMIQIATQGKIHDFHMMPVISQEWGLNCDFY